MAEVVGFFKKNLFYLDGNIFCGFFLLFGWIQVLSVCVSVYPLHHWGSFSMLLWALRNKPSEPAVLHHSLVGVSH